MYGNLTKLYTIALKHVLYFDTLLNIYILKSIFCEFTVHSIYVCIVAVCAITVHV